MKSFCAWEAVVSHENLWRAYKAFSKGKRRRRDVATFDLSAPSQVLHLARRLQEGNWQPGGYKLLRISDPKRRIISCAPVADRVVHHALHQVVAPLLNRRFIEHSYACLPGRGSHRALLHFQRMMREHAYVLKLDIGRYFYSIDQDRLYALLCTRLREAPLRELIRRILHSGRGLYQRRTVQEWLGWDGPMPLHCGLPIGNLTSQWWGNLYLDGADHHVLRNLKLGGYQRYMDDMVLADDDPERLLGHRDALADWLWRERGLRLKNPDAQPISSGLPMLHLGYRVTRTRFDLGPKARGRLPRKLKKVVADPDAVQARIRSFAALWCFPFRG